MGYRYEWILVDMGFTINKRWASLKSGVIIVAYVMLCFNMLWNLNPWIFFLGETYFQRHKQLMGNLGWFHYYFNFCHLFFDLAMSAEVLTLLPIDWWICQNSRVGVFRSKIALPMGNFIINYKPSHFGLLYLQTQPWYGMSSNTHGEIAKQIWGFNPPMWWASVTL